MGESEIAVQRHRVDLAPPKRDEATRFLALQGPERELVGGRLRRLLAGHVEDLADLVAVEVGDLERDRLAAQGQRGGEREAVVGQDAPADLLLLLGEDVDLGLLIAVEVGQLHGPAADEVREALARAQARAPGLAIDVELRVGRVGGDDVGQPVAVEVAQVERAAAGVAVRQRVEEQAAALGRLVVVHDVEGVDADPARLLLDREQLGAGLAVDLAEGVGPERLEREPLLGAEGAALGGEADADRVLGRAFEQDEVEAAVAVEVDGLDHPRVRERVGDAARARRACRPRPGGSVMTSPAVSSARSSRPSPLRSPTVSAPAPRRPRPC